MKGEKAVDVQQLKDIANRLRIDSIVATNASKSGHPTSCASMAEIMSVLFFHTMRYKVSAPRDPSADRFILSKGHAAPILYAAWAEAGLFPVSELKNLRKLDSDLEGHPTPRLSFVDVGTGSLGQGLSVAAGMAYVGKYFDQAPYRVYCLVGDGEAAEGSIWEALHFASHYKLDNLVVIFDVNRLGQSEPTSLQHRMEVYDARLKAFGLHSLVVDGHDVTELVKALDEAAATAGRPTALVAKTYKGKGFPGIEDLENWHGKPLGAEGEKIIKVLQSQIKSSKTTLVAPAPLGEAPRVHLGDVTLSAPPHYKLTEPVATRLAYGTALKKLADTNMRVIALDGDTKNSTFSDKLRNAYPDRYIECFIAEQNLVGVATGAACRDRAIVFVSTFAAFFTRTFDQIRMGAISQSNMNLVGSHCGVSIGEDGPSQMGLEDLALFRTIPTATVFYPSDAVSCERAVELAANTRGICYIRTSRPNTPVLYPNDETFKNLLRSCIADFVSIIENKNTDTNTNKSKTIAWQNLTKRFNELNNRERDLAEIKQQWRTMKLDAKKNLSSVKSSIKCTGGGPKPPSPEPETIEILSMIPQEFETDSNVFDSDSIMIQEVESPVTVSTQDYVLTPVDIKENVEKNITPLPLKNIEPKNLFKSSVKKRKLSFNEMKDKDHPTNREVGVAKIKRQQPGDSVLLIGTGVTLHEAIEAADRLKHESINVNARVLDPFTIKPLDEAAVREHARAVGGRVVVVEDHYQAGGLGEAVLSALALERDVLVKHLYVREVPRSGPPQALLAKYGIDAHHIAQAAMDLLKL